MTHLASDGTGHSGPQGSPFGFQEKRVAATSFTSLSIKLSLTTGMAIPLTRTSTPSCFGRKFSAAHRSDSQNEGGLAIRSVRVCRGRMQAVARGECPPPAASGGAQYPDPTESACEPAAVKSVLPLEDRKERARKENRTVSGIGRILNPRLILGHCLTNTQKDEIFTHQERDSDKMRTNIDIDDRLMRQALRSSGARTKRAAVEAGLRLLIKTRAQATIRRLRGKIQWNGDLNISRLGRMSE